jgi:hypothetical protein
MSLFLGGKIGIRTNPCLSDIPRHESTTMYAPRYLDSWTDQNNTCIIFNTSVNLAHRLTPKTKLVACNDACGMTIASDTPDSTPYNYRNQTKGMRWDLSVDQGDVIRPFHWAFDFPLFAICPFKELFTPLSQVYCHHGPFPRFLHSELLLDTSLDGRVIHRDGISTTHQVAVVLFNSM